VAVEGGSCFVWCVGLPDLGFGAELANEALEHVIEEFWLVECEDHDEWLTPAASEDAIVAGSGCPSN
jgi:hypothetical protein